MANKPTPILFLDLDDTVRLGPANNNGKYVNSPADVELFDGVLDLIKSYKEKGWRVVGVSNQGGVALGHITDNMNNRIIQETNRLCSNLFDAIYTCIHHPDAKEDDDRYCFCRKPLPGLVYIALMNMSQQFGEYYRPDTCLMVGDMGSDMEMANAMNIPFMWASDWRAGKHEI